MVKQEQSEKIVYGSLITSTKCYNCIHFPLCFAQKGGVNLGLASENDCCYYQSKLPKDSVVLSREEYEMLANQYKNLEIKYSNLCDNYRLCKDANETLKQNVIITRKETAEKILLLRGYITKQFHKYHEVRDNAENKYKKCKEEMGKAILNNDWHRADAIMFILEDIATEFDKLIKSYGVDIKE